MRNVFISMLLTVGSAFTSIAQQMPFYESFDTDTVQGVKGKAKLFDGYSISKEITSSTIFKSGNFTIEAWIAVQEYATNVAAIADKERDLQSGYLFGINQYGKLTASFSVAGKWVTLVSDEAVPLLIWTHVAMAVENNKAVSLYINGKQTGRMNVAGSVLFCDSCLLSIGKTQTATAAANTERATSATIKTYNRFDGLIDEFYIHPTTLDAAIIAQHFSSVAIKNLKPLVYRQMPSGPDGASSFGAFYTRLKYAPGWDALWRGSDYPDIVVRFDNSPVKYVFWRGTGYIPAVVNEKNMWMTDQSLEHYGTGECYEAMGDKQTRYSNVRILENTPARVVVHWRYALAGIQHQQLPADEWGWSDWTDEYWTIYPDGVAARKQVLWSKRYEKDKGVMQWQETIFFCQPGTRPQDKVDMKAITFMDMNGEKATYSWEVGPPKKFESPTYKPVELINFRAKYKPYNIFDEKRICNPFSFGNMKEYTTIPNWNHWPVQQVASDGRNAVAPDKPSHSSLTGSNGNMQIVEKKGDGCYWACSLKGMTDGPIDSLMMLARSWNNAPAITNFSSGIMASYDKYARSYSINVSNSKQKLIAFTVQASASSPLYHLPIEINNWNAGSVAITVNNKILKADKDLTWGTVPGLENNKTILFIKIKKTMVVNVKISNK